MTMAKEMATTTGDIVTAIATPDAPTPAGHYVQATAWRDLVFVSGQLPGGVDGTHNPALPFAQQARRALDHVLAILRAAGCGPQDVVKVTAYIVGVAHWPAFNAVYAEAFGASRPARAVVPVPELHHGHLIEIDAIAARPAGRLSATITERPGP
ncbi:MULTISPECIES: RidA family protein [unclassified Bradyrhizobium]|uniref:RidA family protein n=1 Tax=unclassified Bradyrhizobium TaxID=2631580 RepID=UPI0032E46A69